MQKKESPQSKKEDTQERLDGMTQQEVADALQLSRLQVINIEQKAMRKLKSMVARKFRKEDLL
jgi:DNA-directed RNA polymerase sigma subunit (sigma70/sigma32)